MVLRSRYTLYPPAGTWSSGPPVPQCSPVQCPPLEVASPHQRLVSLNTSYLGTATFSAGEQPLEAPRVTCPVQRVC